MPSIPSEALVLVAIMPHPRDMEIARVLGWYRIPYQRAPRTVNVDYLAFYQTARFGAEKWSIRHVAPVNGHELVTRRELLRDEPDHPRADEQYFKLQLGALAQLPRPIPSHRWRRVTFFYTTGALLNTASEINELIVGSTERELLWSALRERGLNVEKQYQPADDLPELDLAVLCALGNLGITLGSAEEVRTSSIGPGWSGLELPARVVRERPQEFAALVERHVGELGGQQPTERAP